MLKTFLFLILSFLIASPCFADSENYIYVNQNGSFNYIARNKESKRSIDEIISVLGLKDGDLYDVKKDKIEIPDLGEDNKYRFFDKSSKKIKIDIQKKAIHEQEIASKKTKQESVLSKMKITKKEWEELIASSIE